MFKEWYRTFGKRIFDLALGITALIVLSPVIVAIALLVRLKLGAPILFRQKRPGLNAKPFTVLKFRTMSDARDSQGRLLPDEKRITTLGRFLRKSSLDELPEAWNVIRGEMSIVGPRPLLIRYLDRYTPEQMRRHETLPGITGWAQINGRNAATWEERFAMDIWYLENLSLGLDIKIIAMTFTKVLTREGVVDGGGCPEEFWGTQGPPADGPLVYPVEQDETYLFEHSPQAR